MPEQPSPEDLIAAIRAEADQMQAAGEGLARVLVSFRAELVSGGVTAETADTLTIGYWNLLVTKGLRG